MGGLFGGASTPQQEGPAPLSGLSIQNSANGLPMPLTYGTTRVSPNLLWYGDFTPIAHTTSQSSGGKGGGQSSRSTSYTYTASFILAMGEGLVAGITNAWIDKTQVAPSTLFSLFLGAYPQSPWSYLTSAHPAEAMGYQGIVYVAASGYDLGNSASLPNHSFEVAGKCILSGSNDADPKDIVTDLLTSAAYGVPNAPALASLAQYSAYCRANGLLLSPCYDSPTAAGQIITDLAQLTNTGVYFSEGVLKFVPYGDAAATGHGATFTPGLTPVANFSDDDFVGDAGADPVIIKRNAIATTVSTTADAYNQVTLEYLDRANSYNTTTVIVQDQASIDVYGLRPASTITAHQIADSAVAQAVAMLILQRAVYVRAQYEFKLGWQWCALEPTDLVTLTDAALGLNLYPVRILSIEEDEAGTLSIVAEDAPPGVSSHVVAPVPTSGGYSVDYNADPGDVGAVCIFEPPYALAAGTGLEVWAGVSGPAGSTVWGGCNVWVSYDGTTYKLLTTIAAPARVGHLTAAISATSAGPLAVQLDGQGGQLLGASATDAAALHTLFYVGGSNAEFMAHQDATLTGANAYSLGGLVRGAYGSAEAIHASGDPFIRLDDALAKSGSLDLGLIGSTIGFKFQSVNVWGGGVQDISTLSAYTYTISGEQATGNAVSGLTAAAVAGSAVLTQISWTASPAADHYEIDQSGDGVTWLRTGETANTTWADSSLFGAATRFRVAAVRARAGTWSSTTYLNVGFVGMWSSISSTPMWSSTSTTPMWS